ncbi:hypothetical protein JCM33374_g5929 [Metschnikowia sp. JCM 33374]|nr:hypothetical protein JCM33374_g5929 [Metschnikowia sp. JCM 33374]
MHSLNSLLLLLLACAAVHADSFSDFGCFAQTDISSVLTSEGSYIYQTPSYCQQLCAGSKVAAVMNGKFCYCGMTVPASSLQADSSKCNVPCQGYGTITCGGSGFLEVFVNGDVAGSTMSTSSSTSTTSSSTSTSTSTPTTTSTTPTSTSSTSTSSKTTNEDTTTSSTSSASSTSSTSRTGGGSSSFSTASPSSSSFQSASKSSSGSGNGGPTTIVSTVTSSPGGSGSSVVEITKTVGSSSSSSAGSNSNGASSNPNGSQKSTKVSGGTIAGAVVGSIAGLVFLFGLFFLIFRWKKNRDAEEDDEDFFDVGNKRAQAGNFDSVPPNTFTSGGGAAGQTRAATVGGHAHNISATDRSYSSNAEDVFYYSNDADRENYFPSNGEEYGRRRLSNGSLPDMLTRNPGSLQVVNN